MTLSEELAWRGFRNQTTYKNLSVLDKQTIKFYWGVDPSSDSMTIGNLAAAMMVRCFMKHGHKATLLVGGATGMIGDPDGKAQERDLLTLEDIASNKKALAAEYDRIFSGMAFKVVDNYDWFKGIGFLEFLREAGKHVPMRQMLGREFVQSRLGEDGEGISYAEFSYSLIQGYDFLHLYREYDVTLQLCGADQWGNSITGVDLIRRIAGGEAHVWSTPLIINKATGKKFGKTEEGAIWLDENKTGVFKFYQFWINADDEGVEDYLKIYTDLDKTSIEEVMDAHNEARSNRLAQKRLAYEVTKVVHGEERAEAVQRITEILFGGGDYSELTASDIKELSKELFVVEAKSGSELAEVLIEAGLATSKRQSREFLNANAVYINGQQIALETTELDGSEAIHGHIILRRGKNKTALIRIT